MHAGLVLVHFISILFFSELYVITVPCTQQNALYLTTHL
jgi:hypothetical protein